LNKKKHIAPLAVFRVIFGAMMLVSVIRFVAKGWVHSVYLKPGFSFSYYGLEWIQPLGEFGMYSLFAIMAVSSLFIMLGLFYRFSIILFFLTFTYVEFIDKTPYLNHYYFVSLVAFLLIFLPANRYFSLDILKNPCLKKKYIPLWTIAIIQFQLGLVYFYAGIAKLNPDWLLDAQPLKTWLPAHSDIPIIGSYMNDLWTAYFFSWFGAVYDLSIPFLLLFHKTRNWAYFFVIAFHIATGILFPIGMFPYIMILSTLIFFPADFHLKLIEILKIPFNFSNTNHSQKTQPYKTLPDFAAEKQRRRGFFKRTTINRIAALGLGCYVLFQLAFPWRHLLYPGNLFWNEEGYRFSWRVMLKEKEGTSFFYVKDPKTGNEIEIDNNDFITDYQEKVMNTKPGMILQFAHYLEDHFKEKGINDPIVRVKSYATLNGSGSRLFIDPETDLSEKKRGFGHKDWVIPFNKISNNEQRLTNIE
ncbi:MAG: HTTM domain-containing protein, partial [Flavobacteriales bacterium]